MRRITDILIDAAFYAFYMLFSCITCMFAELLIVKVLTLCIAIDYFTLSIIRTAIYMIGVSAILAVVAYRGGYKTAFYSIPGTLISGFIACFIHLLFALLFRFEAFCSGGVRFITGLTKFGSNLSESADIAKLPLIDFFGAFFACGVIYVVIMTVFQVLGAKSRFTDREELTGTSSEN